jgi:hypothetical protein
MENPFKNIENRESKGEEVQIIIKFIRHGERDLEGNLQGLGREITKQKAQESGVPETYFDAVKAIGSNAGPSAYVEDAKKNMERSLETAHIYAQEIGGDEDFKTRTRDILSYETIVSQAPYDHTEIYNSFIPENFNELNPEEKALASKEANQKTIEHLISLDSPEAETFKNEIGGSFAQVIEHYSDMTKKLNSESKVLIPAGTHGGTMELLLQKAMVREIDGEQVIGFETLDEIGGDFDPSESFNVFIETDKQGNLKEYVLTFDDPKRPQGEFRIDAEKVKELSDFYKEIHEK